MKRQSFTRIKRIIHPEVVLGLRGPKSKQELYRWLLNQITPAGEGSYKTTDPRLAGVMNGDGHFAHHVVMVKKFIDEKARCFYLPKDFCKALSRLDRAIPLGHLPEKFLCYLEFAQGSLFDDAGPVVGAYLYVGKVKHHLAIEKIKDPEEMVLSISYLNENGTTTKYLQPLKGISMREQVGTWGDDNESYKNLFNVQDPDAASRLGVVLTCINSALYIHSEDTEIALLKPERELSPKKRSEQKVLCPVENETLIPVTILNWSYHTKSFSVDSTVVQTHMRWQPCGPERSRVKLVWVKEHERHYK